MYGQQPYFGVQPQPMYNGPMMMQQPMMIQQPMMVPQQAPPQTIVIMQNAKEATITNMAHFGDSSQCPYCDRDTKNITKRKVGCTTISWCLCLLVTVPGFFWIPFCCDGCKDVDLVC